MHRPFLLKTNPEKVQQMHSRNLLKKKEENLINFDPIEVKSFIMKLFKIS